MQKCPYYKNLICPYSDTDKNYNLHCSNCLNGKLI